MQEHSELRKGRRRLVISIKDNYAGRELSPNVSATPKLKSMLPLQTASIYQSQLKLTMFVLWIQRFSNVDQILQTILKVGRWLNGAPLLRPTYQTSVSKWNIYTREGDPW